MQPELFYLPPASISFHSFFAALLPFVGSFYLFHRCHLFHEPVIDPHSVHYQRIWLSLPIHSQDNMMKFSLALLSFLAGVGAFAPYHALPSYPTAGVAPSSPLSTSTSLNNFGTLGFNTDNLYTPEEAQTIKTQNEIFVYLNELRSKRENKNTVLRSNLGKTVLISGFEPTDPSATEVLDFLNDEDSPHFGFSKILVHAPDEKLAKKRLIGRNARYTGLLDKLDFIEGSSSSSIPTVEQLADVSSWISHIGGGDNNVMSQLASIVDVAEKAESVKNVAILISGANGVALDVIKEAQDMLNSKATTFAYTLLIVPEWNNEPEALCAYGIVNACDLASVPFKEGESFSREESLRILTECLAIDQAAGKCVVANAAKETNSLENMLIQSMRENGFKRIEEVEHMVTVGVKVRDSFSLSA